ncbi:MAG: protein kinase [Polyangiaceae bacterium]
MRFEVVSRLGGGAMGSVHRARDTVTGRMVALKTAIVEDHAQLESLRAETAALARLSHPGIVPIVAHGVEGGAPYLAMELLEGEDLAQALILPEPLSGPQGPYGTLITPELARARADASPPSDRFAPTRLAIPWSAERMERIARVIVRLARALAYLHGEGIVHRDLKPENILLVEDDRPVLVDFGLARFRFGRGRERVSTDRGASGTPYYMSPEQIGNRLLDPRADLYALGALIHHVVAGQPPFVADDLVGLLSQHVHEPPPRLSSLVAGVPMFLDELVLALLEKDREKRLAYAEDVVEVFASLELAPPPEPGEPAPRPYVYGSACVGRAAHEASLEARVDAAIEGETAIVLVRGESGVGKSRLLSECLARVPVDAVVAAGIASPQLGAGDGAAPLLESLRPLLEWLGDHAKTGHADAVKTWLDDGAGLLALYQADLAGLVDPMTSAPLPRPDAWIGALAGALVRTVLRVATDQRVVLVLDDAQWADPATAAFVCSLAAHPLAWGRRLLVVVSYRAEEEPAWLHQLRLTPASASGDERAALLPHVHVLDLHPLDAGAMRELALGMLGSGGGRVAAGVERTLDRVARAAQGNPFTLAETIRAAVEDGSLVREGRGRWSLASESRVVDLLESATLTRAERIAEARLGALGPRARRLTGVLATVGRPAGLSLLASVVGATRARSWELAADLHELVVRGIAIEASPGAWLLAHDKLRERCYASLEAQERAALHLAIARASLAEAREPGARDTAEDAAIRASHFHLGGAPIVAAEEALSAVDGFEARGLVREAEQSADLAWSFVATGAGLESTEGARVRGRAASRLGAMWASLGRLDEAAALLDTAAALGESVRDPAVLGVAHVGLGYVAYLRGNEQALFRHAERAHAAAVEARDEALLARAENTLGIAFGSSGHFRKAIDHYTRAAELAERLGDGASTGKHWSNISINLRLLGDLDDARAAAERALERTSGAATAHANAWANLGRILLEQRAYDAAEDALDRAIAIGRRIGVQFIVAEAEWGRAMVHVARGEPHEAAAHAEIALETSVRIGLTVNEGMARRAEGLIAAMGGDDAGLERAVRLLERAAVTLEGTQEQNELADCLVDLASVLDLRGARVEADVQRERARAIYEKLGMRGRLAELAEPRRPSSG